jgi:hypothetical protein
MCLKYVSINQFYYIGTRKHVRIRNIRYNIIISLDIRICFETLFIGWQQYTETSRAAAKPLLFY